MGDYFNFMSFFLLNIWLFQYSSLRTHLNSYYKCFFLQQIDIILLIKHFQKPQKKSVHSIKIIKYIKEKSFFLLGSLMYYKVSEVPMFFDVF